MMGVNILCMVTDLSEAAINKALEPYSLDNNLTGRVLELTYNAAVSIVDRLDPEMCGCTEREKYEYLLDIDGYNNTEFYEIDREKNIYRKENLRGIYRDYKQEETIVKKGMVTGKYSKVGDVAIEETITRVVGLITEEGDAIIGLKYNTENIVEYLKQNKENDAWYTNPIIEELEKLYAISNYEVDNSKIDEKYLNKESYYIDEGVKKHRYNRVQLRWDIHRAEQEELEMLREYIRQIMEAPGNQEKYIVGIELKI